MAERSSNSVKADSMPATRKRLNRELGAAGEAAAEAELRRRGWRILERNFRCPAGEIDIIAEDRGIVAFVEVKTRSPRAYLPPGEAVDSVKQTRIAAAAKYYLRRYRDPSPVRYDVVSVWLSERDVVERIELVTSAFQP
jgi:putative endonuclease